MTCETNTESCISVITLPLPLHNGNKKNFFAAIIIFGQNIFIIKLIKRYDAELIRTEICDYSNLLVACLSSAGEQQRATMGLFWETFDAMKTKTQLKLAISRIGYALSHFPFCP